MRILLSVLTLSVFSFTLCLAPGRAFADTEPRLRKSDLPASLRYLGSNQAESVANTLPYHHRTQQFRDVEAPTRYRTHSILRYSQPLGDSGLVLRVKVPLRPRRVVKLELRF